MAKSYDEYRLGEPFERPRRKGLKTLAIVAALMAITILPAMAAKGGAGARGHGGSGGGSTTGGNGTIALKMADPTDTVANWADQVTFTVSTTATNRPFVALDCYQGGSRVYGFSAGIFPDYPWTQIYTLKSSL